MFLLISLIVLKFKWSDRKSTLVTTFFTITLTPIVFWVLANLFFAWLFYEPKYRFDEKIWRTDISKRYGMIDDLVNQKRLINKDSAEIEKMFGNQFTRGQDKKYWEYDAGAGGGGLGFRFHQIGIHFKNGKVDSVSHTFWDD